MELYVNPTITGFRQDVDGTIKELKIGSNKEDAYENIIEQGGKKLDNNKTATINVSTYTEPVEILPTSGKDGMKKATITLSNIPSPSGSVTLYAWNYGESYLYTITTTPTTGDIVLQGGETGQLTNETENCTFTEQGIVYNGNTYERDSTLDISLT